MEDCLNSSYDYTCGTGKLKRQKTEVVNHVCDTWTDTKVSTSASVNSASHSYEQKDLTPKQRSRRSLKKQILQQTLDDKLSLEKKDLKKFPKKNQTDENSLTTSAASARSFLLVKGLDCITPPKKTVELNTVPALIDSLSNSSINSEDSLDRSFPVDRNSCILEGKKRKKVQIRCSLKLAASELGASGSKEFLQAVTTYSKSFSAEEASYEDFFSSPDSNENEVQVRVPKESQNPPEVCCKDSFTNMNSRDISCSKLHTASKNSREKSVPASDVSEEKSFKPAEHPGSVPLTYMSKGEKADTAEALDSDGVSRLSQQACEKTYRTSVNYCAHTTGKLLHRAGK